MKMMEDANRSSNVSIHLILRGIKGSDDTGRGWKRVANAGTVAAVKSLIEENHKLTVADISTKVGESYGSVPDAEKVLTGR